MTVSSSCIRLILTAVSLPLLMLSSTAQDKYKTGPAPAYQEEKYKTDIEFARFLGKDWLKMESLPGLAADKAPKPVDIPVAEVTEEDLETLEETFRRSQPVKPAPEPEPLPPPPPDEPLEILEPHEPLNMRSLAFSFFEADVEISYNADLWIPVGQNVDNRTISAFWETISRADYASFLDQTSYYKNHMILNDWGYGLLLHTIGKQIYSNNPVGTELFTWFMMVKAGYDARVGYSENRAYLLFPSNSVWYETPYFQIDGKTYYLAVFDGENEHVSSLFIYEEAYPGAEAAVDLNVTRAPSFGSSAEPKKLQFVYQGQEVPLAVAYDRNAADFFSNYPLTDLPVYFEASASEEARHSLTEALQPVIAGKSEAEAVNILLRFVQTAFDYKTDDIQFGREKYFFPDETLFYPYSDCEDRSVLFSYLVQNLVHLDVIGLDYPGHVATAVKFSDDLPGDYILHQGGKYIICDPTFIHANVGMGMPQYRETTPTVISVATT